MEERAVRDLVLGLPGVEEAVGWAGQPAFRVRGKGFAYLSEDGTSVLLKALREEQEALVAEQPEVFTASFVSGRFGWLQLDLAGAEGDEVRELLTEAWRLSAPKSLAEPTDPGPGQSSLRTRTNAGEFRRTTAKSAARKIDSRPR